MPCIKTFLQDIKNNATLMKLLGNPSNSIDEMIQLIDWYKATQTTKDYIIYKLKDKDYQFFKIENGKIIWSDRTGIVQSYYKEGIIYEPQALHIDPRNPEHIWLADRQRTVAIFDNNFSYVGGWGNYGTNYVYPRDVVPLGTDYVAEVNGTYHRVRVFDRDSVTQLFQIGDGNLGYIDGVPMRVNNPNSVVLLPNGNLLVCDYAGRVSGSLAYGTISEHSMTDGSLIKVHLNSLNGGHAWNNAVYHPSYMRMFYDADNDVYHLYVSYFDRQYVADFIIEDPTNPSGVTLRYNRVYGKTNYVQEGSLGPMGMWVNFETRSLYVALRGMAKVALLDLDTGDLRGYVGESSIESNGIIPQTIVGFNSLFDVIEFNDMLYIVDSGNRKISSFSRHLLENMYFAIEYEPKVTSIHKIYTEFKSNDKFDKENAVVTEDATSILQDSIDTEIIVAGPVQVASVEDVVTPTNPTEVIE